MSFNEHCAKLSSTLVSCKKCRKTETDMNFIAKCEAANQKSSVSREWFSSNKPVNIKIKENHTQEKLNIVDRHWSSYRYSSSIWTSTFCSDMSHRETVSPYVSHCPCVLVDLIAVNDFSSKMPRFSGKSLAVLIEERDVKTNSKHIISMLEESIWRERKQAV